MEERLRNGGMKVGWEELMHGGSVREMKAWREG